MNNQRLTSLAADLSIKTNQRRGSSVRTYKVNETVSGRYHILADPMSGGFGRVYRIRYTDWDIELAMKQPHEKINGSKKQQGFISECSHWFNLGVHPHIVRCHFVREVGGVPSIFSEWIDGGSLTNWIYRKNLPVETNEDADERQSRMGKLYEGGENLALERILDISIQFARGLRYAHKQGIIHCDVKPDNVLITADGIVKMADFGIASAKEGLKTHDEESVACTKAYFSPEQQHNYDIKNTIKVEITHRTDIWSWAVSVLEMFLCDKSWKDGVWAGTDCEYYFNRALIPIPDAMKQLLRRCFKEKEYDRWDNFGEIEVHLLDIYQSVTKRPYPRSIAKAFTETAGILNNKALSYIEMGLSEEAEKYWKKALEKQPDDLDSIFNYTVFLWRNARIDDIHAAGALRTFCENNPGDSKALRLYMNICIEQHDYRTALQLLNVHRELPLLDLDNMQGIKWSMSPVYSNEVLEKTEKKFKQIVNKIKGCLYINDIENALELLEELYQLPIVHRPIRQKINDEISQYCRIKGVRSLFMERNIGQATGNYTFNSEGLVISNQRLYDIVNHKYYCKLDDPVSIYIFSPDNRMVYGIPAGQEDHYLIKAYDKENGKCLFTFQGEHQKTVNDLAMSPDGKYLLSGSDDCTVRLWNIGRRKNTRVFMHKDEVKKVFFGPDIHSFLSLSMAPGKKQGEIFLWNTNPESTQTIKSGVTNICLNRDRTKLITCGTNELELIELSSLETLAFCTTSDSNHNISGIAFFPDDRYALSVGTELVSYWELPAQKCLRSLVCDGRYIAMHPEGNFAVVWDKECKLIRINHLFEIPVPVEQVIDTNNNKMTATRIK
ncbi:MAG: protein kinase [Dysgonamonadaceae bacterium]|jgi:serine/threonine protein kinase|nr:protein kinase [Dysgonamonadaceae bacterium]